MNCKIDNSATYYYYKVGIGLQGGVCFPSISMLIFVFELGCRWSLRGGAAGGGRGCWRLCCRPIKRRVHYAGRTGSKSKRRSGVLGDKGWPGGTGMGWSSSHNVTLLRGLEIWSPRTRQWQCCVKMKWHLFRCLKPLWGEGDLLFLVLFSIR